MAEKDLDTRFKEAVEIADTMTQADLPQDVQLRLYAYYKQALGKQRLPSIPILICATLLKPMLGCRLATSVSSKPKNCI
jgi:hypothetical protein